MNDRLIRLMKSFCTPSVCSIEKSQVCLSMLSDSAKRKSQAGTNVKKKGVVVDCELFVVKKARLPFVSVP